MSESEAQAQNQSGSAAHVRLDGTPSSFVPRSVGNLCGANPWGVKLVLNYFGDEDMIENMCENEKDYSHLVVHGKDPK